MTDDITLGPHGHPVITDVKSYTWVWMLLPPSQDEPIVMKPCGRGWNMDNDHPEPSSDTMRDVSDVSGSQASFRPEPYRDTHSGNQEYS